MLKFFKLFSTIHDSKFPVCCCHIYDALFHFLSSCNFFQICFSVSGQILYIGWSHSAICFVQVFGITEVAKPSPEGNVFPNAVDPDCYMLMLVYKNGSLHHCEFATTQHLQISLTYLFPWYFQIRQTSMLINPAIFFNQHLKKGSAIECSSSYSLLPFFFSFLFLWNNVRTSTSLTINYLIYALVPGVLELFYFYLFNTRGIFHFITWKNLRYSESQILFWIKKKKSTLRN
jgi:hypothetical protein